MKKMAASNVLIVGLNGLGAEIGGLDVRSSYHTDASACIIAKNVCLAGVKSVTLYDPEPVTLRDLSSQVSVHHLTRSSTVDENSPVFSSGDGHRDSTCSGDYATFIRAECICSRARPWWP